MFSVKATQACDNKLLILRMKNYLQEGGITLGDFISKSDCKNTFFLRHHKIHNCKMLKITTQAQTVSSQLHVAKTIIIEK